MLAASGIGAILSPPTLGAAAFIIAEFLKVSYLTVLLYAVIPSLLYYLGILLAIEADARRFDTDEVDRRVTALQAAAAALRLPLLVAVRDRAAARGRASRPSARCSTRPCSRSCCRSSTPTHRMGPKRVFEALAAGARAVLPVAATCAAAGIIVAVVTLTGLGLNLSGIIIDVAGGSLFLCALLAAIAVLLLGPRGAGHRLVHHRRGDRVAGADEARRRAAGGLHVHLLLRGPVRGEPADRAVGRRRRGDHGRQRLPHDDADLEVHAAGLPRPVRVRAHRQRRRAAAAGLGRHGRCSPSRSPRSRSRGSRWRPARGCSARRGCPSGVLCGAAGLVLLYLEPLWIGIGLGLFASASPSTWWGGVRCRAGCAAPRGSARRARPSPRRRRS